MPTYNQDLKATQGNIPLLFLGDTPFKLRSQSPLKEEKEEKSWHEIKAEFDAASQKMGDIRYQGPTGGTDWGSLFAYVPPKETNFGEFQSDSKEYLDENKDVAEEGAKEYEDNANLRRRIDEADNIKQKTRLKGVLDRRLYQQQIGAQKWKIKNVEKLGKTKGKQDAGYDRFLKRGNNRSDITESEKAKYNDMLKNSKPPSLTTSAKNTSNIQSSSVGLGDDINNLQKRKITPGPTKEQRWESRGLGVDAA